MIGIVDHILSKDFSPGNGVTTSVSQLPFRMREMVRIGLLKASSIQLRFRKCNAYSLSSARNPPTGSPEVS
jgi:hypothetical protein